MHPVKSAISHPITIAHQMALSLKIGANRYASRTLKPREINVKTKENAGFSIALYRP